MRQFWTQEKWVRVTDDESGLKFVSLNQPITGRMRLEEHSRNTGEQIPAELMADPRIDRVVEIRNNVSELDVDITLEESPEVANIQQEEFAKIAELFPYSKGEISIYDLIELSTLRGKDKILERRDNPQLAEQANKQSQMEEAERLAAIELKGAQKVKTLSEATQIEIDTKAQMVENQLMQDPAVIARTKMTASLGA